MQGNSYYQVKHRDVLYPKLSFNINGALFDVYKQIDGGHKEEYFQKATAVSLATRKISFTEQYYVPLKMNNETVGKYFLDFFIENKIILKLKRGKFVTAHLIQQVVQYLEATDTLLAIIGCFTQQGVVIKRIVNHEKINRMKRDGTFYTSDALTS